jgi:hypothetical protein
MAGFNVRVDAASIKAIEQALKELPLELKSGAVATAQVNAASVMRNEAKRLGKQLGGSGSWSKSQHVVRGNVKRYSPYVVLKTANKRFSVRPVSTFMDSASPTTFAPVKYNHLIQKGSKPEVRTGGIGKARRGGIIGTRSTGKGGFMVRNAETGYIHRIKQIKHPGFAGHNIYQEVLDNKGDMAVERFNRDAIKIIDRYKRKKGFA